MERPDAQARVAATKDLGLIHWDLSEVVKSMPSKEALGSDGIAAEILRLGGYVLVAVIHHLYKAARHGEN